MNEISQFARRSGFSQPVSVVLRDFRKTLNSAARPLSDKPIITSIPPVASAADRKTYSEAQRGK